MVQNAWGEDGEGDVAVPAGTIDLRRPIHEQPAHIHLTSRPLNLTRQPIEHFRGKLASRGWTSAIC
jgi:hypothetical protein